MIDDPKQFLRALFDAAVAAAAPGRVLAGHLPPPPPGRTIVIGAGKAAAAMARAVEDHWHGPLEGLVVTRYGYAVPCRRIEIVEAAHPVPDAAGIAAAQRILDLARNAAPVDLVLCLISGGASALLALPAQGVALGDKQRVTRDLLRSGATIHEMNCVRKHLSAITGGRLAAACRARVVTLAISDVVGDDPAVIGSGPTVADPTTFAEARDILEKYRIDTPRSVAAHLEAAIEETPKPGDPRLAARKYRLIATPRHALDAAARHAAAAGVRPIVLGDAVEGEAREIGAAHARMARELRSGDRPAAIISGGETTVTVLGPGKGGRNSEYVLGAALALAAEPGIYVLAADTDGIDGSEDNAGAVAAPDSLPRAAALGLDARALLEHNDAWSFFAALDDLVVTGPTFTNVNDFRAILVL